MLFCGALDILSTGAGQNASQFLVIRCHNNAIPLSFDDTTKNEALAILNRNGENTPICISGKEKTENEVKVIEVEGIESKW